MKQLDPLTPSRVQRQHDLGEVYKALLAAQHRAEMAGLDTLAAALRSYRQVVWDQISRG
jgi:hypothetical protein